jgi:hypothetical protein
LRSGYFIFLCRSATLEKEKKQLDQALKTKMQEFEEERSMLEIQIAKMSENLVMHVNAQERVEALQVQLFFEHIMIFCCILPWVLIGPCVTNVRLT